MESNGTRVGKQSHHILPGLQLESWTLPGLQWIPVGIPGGELSTACTIKALMKWCNITKIVGKVEDLLKIDMTKCLEELMASVGMVVNADVKKG